MSTADSTAKTTAKSTAPSGGDTWLLTVKSPYLRKVAWILVVLIMIVHIFMAIVSTIGDTGATVDMVDQFAFVGLGLIFSAAALTLTRARVRVNPRGVEVRNVAGAKFYPWQMIYGLSFPRNSRWARLELPDFEFVPMMAFQIGDKTTVAANVEAFRQLEDRYMPDE
ncbi:PH domain-containing protein [Corynebacterium terpenotabidum]|uniref:Low molecular weight protein antigen 6 PH domain-containing protein n=1 Tax=Corynebacterium terpenotabidum Y-11 TaxID=1200352 RepID=S4XGN4_9CORY|nr:PH domain-containing protein [Corynebacterium terpenotabidum]AGP30815.1 hypothetical protein A606_05840 [Corynebacterium terpenotabidum Y-11]